ncbi:MAG TPA: glycosyltransferase, partial [Rhodothermales bacterium]|nr:glycosyltransferase [Rhodothermales bacterium]
MSAADPLVSIVVPSWQKGRFLRRALESLLRQTYPHIEIIVQDNVSTDETERILADYAPRLTQLTRE